MADGLELLVGGFRYAGFKSIRVTQSIESLAGSFALDVSDRWDGAEAPWTIIEEDACRVVVNGQTVIDGYIDKRGISGTENARTLSFSGRDRAAALVDCSAVLPKWTYKGITLVQLAELVAEPFGIGVSVQDGLTLPKIAKVVISPGDTGYEVLKRAAADEGVLLVSDGAGGILITRSATTRALPLVEGINIKSAQVEYDGAERFYRYRILTQAAATDQASGNATRILADGTDPGVRRQDRVQLIRPDKGYSVASAKARADWEARTRAARAETVTVTVQDWEQPDGRIWRANERSHVRAPRLIGVDGDLVISQVEFSVDDKGGKITQLRLVRPDAFTPNPRTATVGTSGGAWKQQFEKGRF